MTDKPLLLLDIDGVMNLFPRPLTFGKRAKGEPYPEIRDHAVHRVSIHDEQTHPYMIRIPDDAPDLISQLQEHFEIAWYTMWNEAANRVFAPLAGIPEFTQFECDWTRGRLAYFASGAPEWMDKHIWIAKTPLIPTYVGDRPFVWIDDDSAPVDTMYLNDYTDVGPFHLITVEPHTGLTQAVVDEAIDWATALVRFPEEITA